MRRLHQTSTSILGTILLSTSLLSICHSPADGSSINSNNLRPGEVVAQAPPTQNIKNEKNLRLSMLYFFWRSCIEDISFSDGCPKALLNTQVATFAERFQQKNMKLSLEFVYEDFAVELVKRRAELVERRKRIRQTNELEQQARGFVSTSTGSPTLKKSPTSESVIKWLANFIIVGANFSIVIIFLGYQALHRAELEKERNERRQKVRR